MTETPDYSPRPGEVDRILARGTLRRARTAGGATGLAALTATALLVSLPGSTPRSSSPHRVDFVDGGEPSPDAREVEGSRALPPGGTAAAGPARTVRPTPTLPPLTGNSPSPQPQGGGGGKPVVHRTYLPDRGTSETAGGLCTGREVSTANPAGQVLRDGWCLVVEADTPSGHRRAGRPYYDGKPRYGGGSGVSSEPFPGYFFRFLVCRLPDSPSALPMSFPTAQEVDFTVRRGETGPAVWTWSTGQRFARTRHAFTLEQGDCVQWAFEWAKPVDGSGRPLARGEYVIEPRSLAEEMRPFPSWRVGFRVGEAVESSPRPSTAPPGS